MDTLKLKTGRRAKKASVASICKVAVLGRPRSEINFAEVLQSSWRPSALLAANEGGVGEDVKLLEADLVAEADVLSLAANERGEQLLVPYVERQVEALVAGGGTMLTLQVFDLQAANEMVAHYNGLLARLKRTITGIMGLGTAGIPIYYRHPDANPDHVDSREYGRAEDLRAGPDGLYGKLSYNEFGARLLESVKGLRISPTWYLRPLQGDTHTPPRTRPVMLKSLGLTQFPNIPTAVGVNEQPQSQANKKMKSLMTLFLNLLGFNEARVKATIDGGDDAVSLTEAKTALETQLTAANEAKKVPGLEAEVEKLKTEKDKVDENLKAANEAVTSFRQRIAEDEVEAAIADGRIKPCEKSERLKKLVEAADFAVACNELSEIAEGSALKTRSATDGLAKQQSDGLMAANEAADKFKQLVNEYIANGMGYDQAWAAAENSSDGKKLLELSRARS